MPLIMEKIKKENLDKLVDIVLTICEDKENYWFKEKLLNALQSPRFLSDNSIIYKLNNIENFLDINGIQTMDYTDIEDESVRIQLIADNIQMQKYRLGKVNQRVDFEHFCKYAHFQVEELVNYYFHKSYNTFNEIVAEFEKKSMSINNAKKIEEIPYYQKQQIISNKISIIYNQLGIERKINFRDVFYKINDIRNQLSHRSSLNIQKNDDDVLRHIESLDIDLTKSFDLYNGEQREWYNKGKNIQFKRKSDFRLITDAIYQFKTLIVYFIKQKY